MSVEDRAASVTRSNEPIEPDDCDWCQDPEAAANAGDSAPAECIAAEVGTTPPPATEDVGQGVARVMRLMGIPLPRDTDDEDQGVSVLGYLGFFIVNFAAWGMISYSSIIVWQFGFLVCIGYTALLITGARFLERFGLRYRSFQNLLWVLACWFIFVLGMYVSLNIVGPFFQEVPEFPGGGGGNCVQEPAPIYSSPENDLPGQLPAGASAGLTAWAEGSDSSTVTFGLFAGHTLFSARGPDNSQTALMISDGSVANLVYPTITSASSFTEAIEDLYFTGYSSGQGVFRMTASDVGADKWNASALLKVSDVVSGYGGFSDLYEDGGNLYWKAFWGCDYYYGYVRSIYKYDGTDVVNLRGEVCPAPVMSEADEDCEPWIGGGGSPSPSDKPYAQLWSTLICAIGSMLVVASWVLVTKELPGMFFNLYAGIFMAVILLYIIIMPDPSGLFTFTTRFNTAYSSLTYAAITLASLLIIPLPALLEGMKDWIIPLVAIPFWFDIHYNLEIPLTDNFFMWVWYAVLAVVQVVISIIIGRRTPMTMGAICMFVIAWKISFEITDMLFASATSSELAFLTLLSILALQGVGIIAGAVVYASRREEIDTTVRSSLARVVRKILCLQPVEANREDKDGPGEENETNVAVESA